MTRNQAFHLGVQGLRHLTQAAVLVLLVAVVYLSLYAHYRAARALEDEQAMSGVNGTILKQIDQRVATLEDPQAFLDGTKGTVWSMKFLGVDLTDPLAAAEAVAASKTVYGPLLLSILIPVLVTLLLGRVFCSWMCPAGLLFEVTDKLRKVLGLLEIRPADVSFSHRNKYVLLGVGLVVAAATGLPFFALVYPPAVVGRLAHAWVFGTALTGMVVILGTIVAVELFVSPRWWCRSMCPGGALYGLLGAARLLRVKLAPSKCTSCRLCVPVCPMGIDPVPDSSGIECDNCGVCLRHCPDDALEYRAVLPRRGRSLVQTAAARTLLTIAIVVLVPAGVRAHHILGLPHYSYKENYPQVPTLEYPATTGPYDVLMTSYPGRPHPGEPANVAFYIKDRVQSEPYAASITVRVLQTFTFGRNREIVPATRVQQFDRTHKLSVEFPEDGEYVVELTMEVEGQTEVIPFLMIAGDPSATPSVLIAVAGGLLLFLLVVRAIRIKRDRRVRALAVGA